MIKRAFDIIAAAIGLLLTVPLLLIVAICIVVTTRSSSVYAQTRVGRDEKLFTCFKLRTMQVGTPIAGTHEIAKSAVTPIGRILRAVKLDELPQLWNVLRGDMSLVGPRPCLPIQEELIRERRKRGVYALRPGITGVAQIQAVDMSEPVRLAVLDAQYLTQQRLVLDMRIILATLTGAGRGDVIDRYKERSEQWETRLS